MTTTPPVTVELERWAHRLAVYGDRWTLVWKDRALLTFGTEFEVRQAARQHGWEIVAVLGFGSDDR